MKWFIVLLFIFNTQVQSNNLHETEVFFKKLKKYPVKNLEIKNPFSFTKEQSKILQYLNQHKKELNVLKIGLEKIKLPKNNLESKVHIDLELLHYLKLMSYATLYQLDKGNIKIKNLKLQLKLFKLFFEQKNTIAHMLSMMGEEVLFHNLPSSHIQSEEAKKLLKTYHSYRLNRLKQSLEGDLHHNLNTFSLNKQNLYSQQILKPTLALVKKQELEKIVFLFHLAPKKPLTKIENEIKANYPQITSSKIIQVYLDAFLHILSKDSHKNDQIHQDYIKLLASTMSNLITIKPKRFLELYTKDKHIIKQLESIMNEIK